MRKTTQAKESITNVKDATVTKEVKKVKRTIKGNEKKDYTVITALEEILKGIHDSELKEEVWEKLESPLCFLRTLLGLTNMQIATIAMLIDAGQPLNLHNIACYMKCSRLKLMLYKQEIEQLIKMRWTAFIRTPDGKKMKLVDGVTDAFSKNIAFKPEQLSGLTEIQFYNKLHQHLQRGHSYKGDINEEFGKIIDMVEANPDLEVCKMAKELGRYDEDKEAFLEIVDDYIYFYGTPDEGLARETIEDDFDDPMSCLAVNMMNGEGPLFEKKFIEFKCEDGIADNERYFLTSETKHRLFPTGAKLGRVQRNRRNSQVNNIKKCKDIKAKEMYYNASEQTQVEQLASLLSKDNLINVQARLEENGMRKGFACILYGGPGTGKTETVLQIARKTGRDIMQVDIAGLRDKWVGESEKNLKQIFINYRELCKGKELIPILFFNEADALISKRSTRAEQAVDKMENAMQNILLQEIEDLDGILIATTNLTENMDSAFERRFIYKIHFNNPNTDVKAKIWSAMMKDISEEEAKELASRYDFSGGQIENIARKKVVEYILSGEKPTIEQLDKYCKAEQLASRTKRQPIVGFGL